MGEKMQYFLGVVPPNEYKEQIIRFQNRWSSNRIVDMEDEICFWIANGEGHCTNGQFSVTNPIVGDLINSEVVQHFINSNGNTVAIVVTTFVRVVFFDEVTAEHAFKKKSDDNNREFHNKLPVVCDRFQIIHKKNNAK
ncbi:hypothetical protein [Paenibacillus monticola]|uniref:Uncharacterized protein n=1 Tax=Paenibacillus monticola TaxID=2666075 RepID=A0A7X2L4U9_9BACL|nr:hypothetical protein [Paenibacillus monticola]MRN56725.1 hypothetical protein [Paenibacillus monticola]